MKQFKIDVSHASPGQLLTIAAELKIMSNAWEKFGPADLDQWSTSYKRQELHENKDQASSCKLQAPSFRHI
jgi:hypothetical protein